MPSPPPNPSQPSQPLLPSSRGSIGRSVLIGAIAAAIAGLGACAGHPATPKAWPERTMDSDILGLLAEYDDHALRLATEAQVRSPNLEIQAYAERLHREHVRSLVETERVAREAVLIPAGESAAIQDLRTRDEDERARLAELEGAEFDRALLDATVRGHQEALDLIDDRLLQRAFDPAVRQHLERTRGGLAEQLEQAQRLRP